MKRMSREENISYYAFLVKENERLKAQVEVKDETIDKLKEINKASENHVNRLKCRIDQYIKVVSNLHTKIDEFENFNDRYRRQMTLMVTTLSSLVLALIVLLVMISLSK